MVLNIPCSHNQCPLVPLMEPTGFRIQELSMSKCARTSCEKSTESSGLCEDCRHLWAESRLRLYGALWLFCTRYHSGQWSRGYRILSRLCIAGYRRSPLSQNRFESQEERDLYRRLRKTYRYDI